MLNGWVKRAFIPIGLLLFLPLFVAYAVAQSTSPFCADANCIATRQTLKSICDFIVKDKSTFPTIYVGGYYMRDLVAVYENIEFLLRTQLPDGTWSKLSQKSWDRTRSPGIVNYLTWYYNHVDRDPRIVRAVHRFDAFIVVPANGKSYGLLNDDADFGPKDNANAFNTVTSLTGRALADIRSPGVDAKW